MEERSKLETVCTLIFCLFWTVAVCWYANEILAHARSISESLKIISESLKTISEKL